MSSLPGGGHQGQGRGPVDQLLQHLLAGHWQSSSLGGGTVPVPLGPEDGREEAGAQRGEICNIVLVLVFGETITFIGEMIKLVSHRKLLGVNQNFQKLFPVDDYVMNVSWRGKHSRSLILRVKKISQTVGVLNITLSSFWGRKSRLNIQPYLCVQEYLV